MSLRDVLVGMAVDQAIDGINFHSISPSDPFLSKSFLNKTKNGKNLAWRKFMCSRWSSMMQFRMFRVGYDLKVLWSVIVFVVIDVMNNFRIQQWSSKMRFHNQALFNNVAISCRSWMIWLVNSPIATRFNVWLSRFRVHEIMFFEPWSSPHGLNAC